MRTYELVVAYNPRVADDEVTTLTDELRQMLAGGGGVTITKTDVWGRRRLAYDIEKNSEGKYVVLYFASEAGAAPIGEVERRLQQNDRVLRFLTVRTDQDLKRAGMPLPLEVEQIPAAAEETAETASAASAETASAEVTEDAEGGEE